MTHYQSGAAFRRALEERLRSSSLNGGIPLARLRKMVAFDRFLARLIQLQSDTWVLKGGFAIQLRVLEKARTTKDIDILTLAALGDVLNLLRMAGQLDLVDWFQFEVEQSPDQPLDEFGGHRFHIRALLDSRTFEEFHMDVGIGDPVIDPVDQLQAPGLLEFAGIPPARIPCYPVTQQIAEKVHAYTRPHGTGTSSRVKDFVDILLLAQLGVVDADRLYRAIQATFNARKTHPAPSAIPNDQLPAYYASSLAFVLPSSETENTGIVLLEAMACGVPVIASNVGGTGEVIRGGIDGILVPAQYPEALAKALDKIMGDPVLSSRMGLSASLFIKENSSWER